MKDYKVTRAHLGDKPYARGETRTADPRKVKHLVERGVLVDAGEKAAPDGRNKAAPEGKNKASKD